MKQTWQLQDAKNKLSEVVERANHEGPQIITRRGKEIAVLLSQKDYLKLTQPKGKLSDFFRNSPLAESDIDLSRDNRVAPSRLEF